MMLVSLIGCLITLLCLFLHSQKKYDVGWILLLVGAILSVLTGVYAYWCLIDKQKLLSKIHVV